MATKKKLLQAAAGSAGGAAALNVEDVFSTYLYEGNGGTQTITNGIDLDGEGGLVWIKARNATYSNALMDTERGFGNYLISNSSGAENSAGDLGWTTGSFNSNGFTTVQGTNASINGNGDEFTSWTFRKAPKFFDVVTYTGDGTSSQQIAHNLGVTPGVIIVKAVSSVGSNPNWLVWHRSFTQSAGYLNSTQAFGGGEYGYSFNQPSDTYIDVKKVGSIASGTNDSGITYVAYLFAHNDGDGEFGPDGDADIIKCGSYSGTSPEINLGWEPQWILTKNASTTSDYADWAIVDNMRGLLADGENTPFFRINESSAEESNANPIAPIPTSTGFRLTNSGSTTFGGANSDNYIYIAIRRGPMAVPTDATEVFAQGFAPSSGEYIVDAGFPVDATVYTATGGLDNYNFDRLRGNGYLLTNTTAAETSSIGAFDSNTSFRLSGFEQDSSTYINWMWRRAPNFCDVVAYTGNGTAGRTVSHNLGVAPEMMWVKNRDQTSSWSVNGSVGSLVYGTNKLTLHQNNSIQADTNEVTAVSATNFTLGDSYATNGSSDNIIAYLFASLDGVSKVFSVTKSSGSDASVNCGFSAGPRFVLLKRTDSTGDWYVWDTERGIVAGNDPYLLLNSTAAEVTSTDYIDPTSNGFTIVNGGLADGDYIGYSVA